MLETDSQGLAGRRSDAGSVADRGDKRGPVLHPVSHAPQGTPIQTTSARWNSSMYGEHPDPELTDSEPEPGWLNMSPRSSEEEEEEEEWYTVEN